MGFFDFHPFPEAHKLAHDVEVAGRRVDDQGHDRRLGADIIEVETDLARMPHL